MGQKKIIRTMKNEITLKEKGFTHLEYGEHLEKRLNELLNSWKDFCDQSVDHKNLYPMTLNGGYESKNKTGQTFDQKENFHISLSYKPGIENATIVDTKFFTFAKNVIIEMFDPLLRVAKIFEEYSDFDLGKLFTEAQIGFTLRCLHYPAECDNKIIAAPHIDKGITVHLIEDAPGLEILRKGVWCSVPQVPRNFLVYPGMLGQYYSKCEFPALCHRVVSNAKSFAYGRNSIVMFIDFGDVVYDKSKYGRTQDLFPGGENYHMKFEDFSKLFTSIENVVV